MTDTSTQRAIDRLAGELGKMQRDIENLRRGQRRPQLANASTTGSIEFMDPETEQVRLRIGRTADGFGLVTEGGDPPTAPTTPVVAPAPLGLMARWDGQLANEVTAGPELDHAAVFIAETDDFAASAFAGTIPRAGGVAPIVPLEVAQTYHVWLVGVTTGGVQGDPSAPATGVPEGVGGVPEPGSITETMIAADAISTPKLQAEAVAAANIAANAVNAGHITAGAVDASKLAATLVLASTIIAGTPGAARCELTPAGLRVYDDADALIGAFEGGSIALTGTITSSTIEGSSFRVDGPEGHIYIGPSALNPDLLTVEVAGNDGSKITLGSAGIAELEMTPPPGSTEDYYAGLQWAYELSGDTWQVPALVIVSPKGAATLPSAAQAEVQLEGGSTTVNAARARIRGDVIQLGLAGFTQRFHGVVEVEPGLSIRAHAHAPVRTDMQSEPPLNVGGGTWVDFTESEMPAVPFNAPYSGRIEVVITAAGFNSASAASSIALGFRVLDSSGTQVVDPHIRRCWYVSGRAHDEHHSRVIFMDGFTPGEDYTLVPAWRLSSLPDAEGEDVQFNTAFENSVVVKPLI